MAATMVGQAGSRVIVKWTRRQAVLRNFKPCPAGLRVAGMLIRDLREALYPIAY